MDPLISRLRVDFPSLTFTQGDTFRWTPKTRQIIYASQEGDLHVLHELGHALLEHTSYNSDIALLKQEANAWEKAKELAAAYKVRFDTEHVQRCLDSYRDWLHGRSTCPYCKASGLQQNPTTYLCTNCHRKWNVTEARFCRVYRRKLVDA